jgi:hypothetical protein
MVIHANNPLNQSKMDFFERKHHQHTLITVNLEEIKDQYTMVKNNGSKGSAEENHNS